MNSLVRLYLKVLNYPTRLKRTRVRLSISYFGYRLPQVVVKDNCNVGKKSVLSINIL